MAILPKTPSPFLYFLKKPSTLLPFCRNTPTFSVFANKPYSNINLIPIIPLTSPE